MQRREACSESETLGSFSLGKANQRLTLRASGCLDSLTAVEVPLMAPKNLKRKIRQILFNNLLLFMSQERIHYFSSQIQDKIMERMKTFQQLLIDIRGQVCRHTSLWWLNSQPVILKWGMHCRSIVRMIFSTGLEVLGLDEMWTCL